jgi:hypothetical protein
LLELLKLEIVLKWRDDAIEILFFDLGLSTLPVKASIPIRTLASGKDSLTAEGRIDVS